MIRKTLRPLSWLYTKIMQVRNIAYNRHIFSIDRVNIPVISVGNLSVGGTGKTPLVEHLARDFQSQGKTVAIVSRGYKRTSEGQVVVSQGSGPEVAYSDAGDEPFMLAKLLPQLRIVVNTDRVAGARYAEDQLGADLVILDDGFQHRALARDIDIVLVPIEDLRTSAHVLPEGRLRESWNALKRATYVIVPLTPAESPDHEQIHRFISTYTDAPVYFAEKKTTSVLQSLSKAQSIPFHSVQPHANIFGIAGIGHPENFRDELERIGFQIVEFQSFPDHFPYPLEVQASLIDNYKRLGADYFLMTAKDYVKWAPEYLHDYPIYYLPTEYHLNPDFMDDLHHRLTLIDIHKTDQ